MSVCLVVLTEGSASGSDLDPQRDSRRWEADGRLQRGDLSPIDVAFQKHDLRELWYFYDKASAQQYAGRTQSEASELQKTLTEKDFEVLNARIKAHAGELLAQIPGHAKLLGDEIETASNAPASYGSRSEQIRIHNFFSLERLASPEAIQQIGRFLDDERNPNEELGSAGGSTGPMPNSFNAVYALDHALGKNSPFQGKRLEGGMLEPEQMRALKAWWRSDASLSYRQPLPGAALPEYRHYDYKRTTPAKGGPSSENEGESFTIWLWVACLGLLLLALMPVWRACVFHRNRSTR